MSRIVMVAFLAAMFSFKAQAADTDPEGVTCNGLSVEHFEQRFPETARRLVLDDAMLPTFIELWQAGARPDLPKRPERIVIYRIPGLPLIIGYQERHCIIAYLAIDSAVLWGWLRPRLGWNA